MYKIKKVLLLGILVAFTQLSSVKAASTCDYNEQAELNSAVANIKATYEEAEKKTGVMIPQEDGGATEESYEYFKITFYNLTEDFYLKITNDYNNEVKTITYSDSESGVGTYEWSNLNAVTNFTIKVYSSNSTNCPHEEYRIMSLTTPRYNNYYDMGYCNGNEDFYLCQKYITEVDEIDLTTFSNKLSSFLAKKNNGELNEDVDKDDSWFNQLTDFIKEYKVPIIIISTLIVVGGVVAIVIVIKKRRSRLI